MHRATPLGMKLFKISMCADTNMSQTCVCRGVVLFMIIRLFGSLPAYFCSEFWVYILLQSLFFTRIQTSLQLKSNRSVLLWVIWMWSRFCKEFRYVSDVHPSSQSETLGKKIVCLGKVYEVDYAKLIWGYPQFPLWAALIKQAGFCYCFRRKATLLKKV